jgi:peptide/nickel transport system permease protein
MAGYVARRIIQSIFVLLAITMIVFAGVNLIGNPVDVLVGADCTQACRERAIERLGLDLPLWEQYLVFLRNLADGDLGRSFVYGQPALGIVLQRLPATLELTLVATIVSLAIGFPVGIWAGLKRETVGARTVMAVTVLGFSIPTFWIGILLIILFGVQLGLLPVTGRGETVSVLGVPFSFLTLDGLRHMILPALTLALYKTSLIIRVLSNGTTEVMFADYIRFARAKGLKRRRIIGLHALKNILIPIVTVLGIEFGTLIAFAVVTETIFSWPGIGKLVIEAIGSLDRPVIVAYMLVVATLFVFINLVVDITYSLLDPRIRLGDE